MSRVNPPVFRLKTLSPEQIEFRRVYCILRANAITTVTEYFDLIQRNATITSFTEQAATINASEPEWFATGTLERYGVEIQWQARRRPEDVHWVIELAPQDYIESDGAFDRETVPLVIEGAPDWRTDVTAVLAPYPPGSSR